MGQMQAAVEPRERGKNSEKKKKGCCAINDLYIRYTITTKADEERPGCRRKRNECGDTGLVRTDGAKDAECEDNRKKEEDILRY